MIKDFVKSEDVSVDLISEYESYLPAEVIDIWRECGFGTFYNNQFIGIVKYRYGENDVIADGFDYFFEDLEASELDEDFAGINKYNKAIKKYGSLKYDECFGYVPLLGLGGNELVENIKL